MTFSVDYRRHRGSTAVRERAKRDAAKDCARGLVNAFQAAMAGRRADFIIEVARWVIRALSKIVEAEGDIGRAQGVLAGAAADIAPAWRSEAALKHDAADALFAREEAA